MQLISLADGVSRGETEQEALWRVYPTVIEIVENQLYGLDTRDESADDGSQLGYIEARERLGNPYNTQEAVADAFRARALADHPDHRGDVDVVRLKQARDVVLAEAE